ncbi:ATP-binding protein [Thermodesulfobacteriota bacterium]
MEAIGNLAGGVAHDFNNILLPILAHSEMALMELPTDSPVRQSIQHIYKAGERARDLVKQILTFARRREEKRVPIRIPPIVNEAIKFLRSTIPSTIEIQYHIKTEQDTVLADPTQINQIVMNLCTNATHAMREKGGVLVISQVDKHIGQDEIGRFGGLSPGQYLKLSVGDTGPGIDPAIIEKIFEPYFTTKGPGEGTGMGLAVIHGIVKSYGGDITVESEQGRGATFNILLPKIVADIAPREEQTIETPKGTERILYVDDEKAAVDAIRPMLESLGYHITARTSSIEALEAFRYKPDNFDLVITDQTMPNMTGKNLAKELMSIRNDIPIILCMGFSEQIDERMSKELGINAFLMKPIVMRQMAQTIREVLDNK